MSPYHRPPAAVAAALLLCLPAAAAAQAPGTPPVRYEVGFATAAHHEANVRVTFRDVGSSPLEVAMSRASPGRYALHEFARHVYGLQARDGSGRSLRIEKRSPSRWALHGHDGTVTVTYTLFGGLANGTYTGIDRTHAHLNMPATFLFAPALEERPVEVRFRPPAGSGWKVATQLVPTDDSLTFRAPDLRYFLDSPTELSDFTLREWSVPDAGYDDPVPGYGTRPGAPPSRAGGNDDASEQALRLAIHHRGTAAEVDSYVDMAQKVVEEQVAIFGEYPDFDYGTYTFIADYLPHVDGDGMEHRNSTILTSTRPLSTGALANLRTLSHEFIHAWNMERVRADAIQPFRFLGHNMSSELWFGEGFTSYYDDLTMRRAGLLSEREYLDGIAGLVNAVLHSPARTYGGPAWMSRHAPFVDAAEWVDPTNFENTFLSYYTYGAALGLGLDLALRTRYETTLDAYMRAVWRAHGRTEEPYTHDDLREILARVSGDREFARRFFEEQVTDSRLPDFRGLLAEAGYLLRKANLGRAWIGADAFEFTDRGARAVRNTRLESPLYRVGVGRGDVVLSLDGRDLAAESDLRAVLGAHAPGDEIPVRWESDDGVHRGILQVGEDPTLEIVPYEKVGREVTAGMEALREAWQGSKR